MIRKKKSSDEGSRTTPFDMEMLFRALADGTRLRLLNLMSGGEVCVCFFVEILGEGQPKISRHLAYLRRAGIVKARRDGKWMHYRIVPPSDRNAAEVLHGVMRWLGEEPAMRRDRTRLNDVCCAPDLPPELAGAPRPELVQIDL
jgi:ArsR family transcriptional regulator